MSLPPSTVCFSLYRKQSHRPDPPTRSSDGGVLQAYPDDSFKVESAAEPGSASPPGYGLASRCIPETLKRIADLKNFRTREIDPANVSAPAMRRIEVRGGVR